MINGRERDVPVVVTGAGFTRAVVPDAPLLVGDFDNEELDGKVAAMPAAARLFRRERTRAGGRDINLERLMTRIETLMPYDRARRAGNSASEYEFLLSELKRRLEQRIRGTREGEIHETELHRFAGYCVASGCQCITFNYDDFLDEALYLSGGARGGWNPFAGYGFFCKAASEIAGVREGWPHGSSLLLLKLHGSINWRRKVGYGSEGAVDAIVHHHAWSGLSMRLVEIEDHLEPEPVIVPPVLSKSALGEPVMRLVWSRALDVLERASDVTFVGYSFPETDLAARTLFDEGLEGLGRDRIRVVNKVESEQKRDDTKRRYELVFGNIPEENFLFEDALEWIRRLPAMESEDEKGP